MIQLIVINNANNPVSKVSQLMNYQKSSIVNIRKFIQTKTRCKSSKHIIFLQLTAEISSRLTQNLSKKPKLTQSSINNTVKIIYFFILLYVYLVIIYSFFKKINLLPDSNYSNLFRKLRQHLILYSFILYIHQIKMNIQDLTSLQKNLRKIKKIIQKLSKDDIKHIDDFDIISYSIHKMEKIISKSMNNKNPNQFSPSETVNIKLAKTMNIKQEIHSQSSFDQDQEVINIYDTINKFKQSTQKLNRKINLLSEIKSKPQNRNRIDQYKEYLKQIDKQPKSNPKLTQSRSKFWKHEAREVQKLDQDILKITKEIKQYTKI